MLSPEFTEWLIKQGVGPIAILAILAVCVLFGALMRQQKRLMDIIRDRKADRDQLLMTLGRLEAHMQRSAACEAFSGQAMREILNPDIPKRRKTDTLLIEGLRKDESGG